MKKSILITVGFLLITALCFAESGDPTVNAYIWNGTQWIKWSGAVTSTDTAVIIDALNDVYNQLKSSVTVTDWRYVNKVSTGSAGKIFASDDISPDDEVAFISFYTEGGNAQISCTFRSGIIYIREGIPAGISVPNFIDNPTFQCTLDASTTLYYISDEVD